MKYTNLFIFLFCLFVVASCTKPKIAEEENPAARSDYSSKIVMQDASNWISADPIKRRIGSPTNTGSMLRTFDSKSVLLVEKLCPTDVLNIGDIIGYSNPNLAVTQISHRLIRINSDGTLVFKGDYNDAEDPAVPRSAVEWRIVGILYTNGQ